ncbi:class I adenylate-forming enzyme family protein [Halobaculum limi]|uniref:class I adenylate-forming enzyme family protein n=1 Tax=Halobaculum limi TaxID=3031916 RepID=UPI0024075ECB|nr:class I adenylate-forming enzyme family protein [Halobaculum sp. YSMS11]
MGGMRDWLSHRVAATPDAEALVLAATGETLTYADLDARVEALASRLAGLGIVPGDHLAVVLGNRAEYVVLVHAAMRLGVRIVPCSDRLTAAELRPKLDAADATALVCGADTETVAVEAALDRAAPSAESDEADATETGWRTEDGFQPARIADEDIEEDAGGPATPRPHVPVVSVDTPEDDRVVDIDAAPDGSVPSVRWGRGDHLLMLFTSGSTGDPKLVPLTMGNVLASATASAFRLGVLPDDRYLATLSLHHTGGIMPLYRAALYGTSVVLRRKFDAGAAVDDIRRYEATGVSLVPTMLKRMLDARGTLPDSLRTVLLGGAPAPDALIERCRNYSVPVHPTWGMTEAASQLATAPPDEAFAQVGTVGRPLLWVDVAVCDADGTPLPTGETGELVVAGPAIADAYYDDPEATAAAFTDGGALRTGDVGYRDEDGFIYLLNRLDDRIITGGENVEPGEVAATLREHAGIAEAVVVGIPDEEWGERVAAMVVADDPDLTTEDVEAFCRERLAGFKIPRTIAFADELPRTVSGTVRRPEVRDRLVAAQSDDATATADVRDDGQPADIDPSGIEETDAQEAVAEETDAEEVDAKETDAEEVDAKETDAQEAEAAAQEAEVEQEANVDPGAGSDLGSETVDEADIAVDAEADAEVDPSSDDSDSEGSESTPEMTAEDVDESVSLDEEEADDSEAVGDEDGESDEDDEE